MNASIMSLEISVGGLALVLMLADLFIAADRRQFLAYAAIGALGGMLLASFSGFGSGDLTGTAFHGMFVQDALAVFFNSSLTPGTLNSPLVLPSPGASQLAIMDMNGDGMADLISADYNVSLFLQSSPGTFAAPISLYPGGANWVAVGDLTGRGDDGVGLLGGQLAEVLVHLGACALE